jgi:UPF0755 protein
MWKKIRILFIIFIVLGAAGAGLGWYAAYRNNISEGKHVLYIPTGATFAQVTDSLEKHKILKDKRTFEWIASMRKYKANVKPGRYVIKGGMNNWDLVAKLRSGNQDAVHLRFSSHWLTKDVLSEIAPKLELSFESLDTLLSDKDFIASLGFNDNTIPCLFIPNTYDFFWNVKPRDFFLQMKKNYDKFWSTRKEKLTKTGLTETEVCAIASIVQRESAKIDEYPTIAGLYVNRVKKGMKLQADPTVKFACGKFDLKRVLNSHLKTDSPFNTYMYEGIPPGPISIPESFSIDAVLNYESHSYIFMCAKADFSGYHNFSKTNAQHEKYAREYKAALDKAGIR